MQAFAVALGGAAIAGGVAGYALIWWRTRKAMRKLSTRDILANVAFGALLGFVVVACTPKMAATFHAPVWHENVTAVTTTEELNAIVHRANDSVVLVYFYAPWCIPCRAMTPNVNRLARQGRIVLTVNVEEARHVARVYNVRSVPTIYVFNGGDITYSGVGYHSLKTLRKITR